MSVTCRVKTVVAQRLAARTVICAADDLDRALQTTFEDVWTWLNAHEHVTAGPPIATIIPADEQQISVEAGFPIAEPLASDLPYVVRELPAGRAATALHEGPYSDLGRAYHALEEFVRRERLQPLGAPYHVYWVAPSQVETPDLLRTEIVWPVA